MKKKVTVLLFLFILSLNSFAQETSADNSTGMRSGGKIYVVIGVLAIIWLGFGIYLFRLENRIKKIEDYDSKQQIQKP